MGPFQKEFQKWCVGERQLERWCSPALFCRLVIVHREYAGPVWLFDLHKSEELQQIAESCWSAIGSVPQHFQPFLHLGVAEKLEEVRWEQGIDLLLLHGSVGVVHIVSRLKDMLYKRTPQQRRESP